ncbi:SGNH hydrolase, partial [Mollisia scopiformis]
KPAAIFLVGDSTTAAPSGSGGGWGNGFLGTLVGGAIGTNFGHNGATTVSFVSGGDWTKVLASITKYKSTFLPFVTIQFGHNDQKSSANISIAEFSTNLKAMAQDVMAAGGTPILVTSLSRRNYDASGLIKPDLANVVNATLSVAMANWCPFIDLNKASMKYLNAIGEANAMMYDRVAGDSTHLNAAGDLLFGNMVSWFLSSSDIGVQVEAFLGPNATIVKAIEKGTFVLP